MLVNTFGKKLNASLMVKDSQFYIEVAKFVQAYVIILNNPNDFLSEISEPTINLQNEKISWQSLSKIMQKCNFGFSRVPTDSDLLVYYNYAIEMGSISRKDKRLATVDDIADAQKNYYNFVDEAKDRAEAEFLKQHRISKLREREVNSINNKLRSYNFQKWVAFSLTIVAIVLFCLGVAGLVFNNPLVEMIGSILPIFDRQYVGAIILIALAILMFWLCDRWQFRSKQEYLKLSHASQTIFSRNNQNFVVEQVLKYKLDSLKRDLVKIQKELDDETKAFDVKNNIEKLSETNEYYKKYLKEDFVHSAEARARQMTIDDEKELLSDAQSEFEPQEIILEGQFDEQAYNEKFEKSSNNKPQNSDEKQEEQENEQQLNEKLEDESLNNELQEENEKNNIQLQNEQVLNQEQEEDMDSYLDYIETLLGKDERELN